MNKMQELALSKMILFYQHHKPKKITTKPQIKKYPDGEIINFSKKFKAKIKPKKIRKGKGSGLPVRDVSLGHSLCENQRKVLGFI